MKTVLDREILVTILANCHGYFYARTQGLVSGICPKDMMNLFFFSSEVAHPFAMGGLIEDVLA